MNVYLAGPMRGRRNFNVDEFDSAAEFLRSCGYTVFNPCDHDREKHGPEVFQSETGDLADIAHLNFNLRETLAADLNYILGEAEGIAMLEGWLDSKGATAEYCTARAVNLPVLFLFRDHAGWRISQ